LHQCARHVQTSVRVGEEVQILSGSSDHLGGYTRDVKM
jgi:hypothetical protein